MDKVLSIAGFDPSAGAGLLADIKVFDSMNVYGFGVCTAVTIQNEYYFQDAGWLKREHILEQMNCLFREHSFQVTKIGLVESLDVLKDIIIDLKRSNPGMKIIWDPILKSSSGFSFHEANIKDELTELLEDLYLITPNAVEAEILGIAKGTELTNVLVKGGHKEGPESEDLLFTTEGKVLSFISPRMEGVSKHGSGCVFSSAIAASLTKGASLAEAVSIAKEHVTDFLSSTDSLLGINRKTYEKA